MSMQTVDRPPPARHPAPRWSVVVVALVAVMAAVIAAAAIVLARSDSGGTGTAPAAPSTQQPTAPSAGPTSGPSSSGSGRPSTPATVPVFGYLPLYPFTGVADAMAWQREASPGGHQPALLDAKTVALDFTQQYLGFTTIDRTAGTVRSGDQAWVTVATRAPDGRDIPAATIHLARIGDSRLGDRPWEVVGTRDTLLSLTTPRYGSTVSSPVTVGGRITGVDEALSVQVRCLSQPSLRGQVRGIMAGGQSSPWTAEVSFDAEPGQPLTIVVATASHRTAGVDAFAITGVRSGDTH